jgi:hypothetical protein
MANITVRAASSPTAAIFHTFLFPLFIALLSCRRPARILLLTDFLSVHPVHFQFLPDPFLPDPSISDQLFPDSFPPDSDHLHLEHIL